MLCLSVIYSKDEKCCPKELFKSRPTASRSPPALPPYPHQTAWPQQASSSIYPTLKR